MKSVRVLEEAAEDLQIAKEFYDQQESVIGDYCVRTLLDEIVSLETLHGTHKIHWGVLRMLSKKFPYGIFYRDSVDEVQVIAELDLRRNPASLKKNISSRT